MLKSPPSKNEWIGSGVDAVGLLIAAFLAIQADTLVGFDYALFVQFSLIAIVIALLFLLLSVLWKARGVMLRRGVFQGGSWAAGLLAGIGVRMILSMTWPLEVLSAWILLVVAILVIRQRRFAKKRLDQPPRTQIDDDRLTTPSSETWLREKDLDMFSLFWILLMTVLGSLIGLIGSIFLLLYVSVFTDWIFAGIAIGVLTLGSLGPLRNTIVKKVASRGFPAIYNFQRLSSLFYAGSVVSGAVGIQEPRQIFPLATLFLVFIYMFLLWYGILDRRELGRLLIFQFLTERDRSGRGYSWLQRGLRIIRLKLQTIGVSVKRNCLYFGSSYSLLEGSDVEGDLDRLYLLGDWSSKQRAESPVHDVTSWFVYRSRIAETAGFESVVPLADYAFDTVANLGRSAKGLVVFAATLVGLVVGIFQLLHYLGVLH